MATIGYAAAGRRAPNLCWITNLISRAAGREKRGMPYYRQFHESCSKEEAEDLHESGRFAKVPDCLTI
jgi:hypothetical protein